MPISSQLSRRALLRLSVLAGLSLSSCVGQNDSVVTLTSTTESPSQQHFLGARSKQIAAGYSFSALLADNHLFTWGINRDGQLGDGTTVNRHIPTKVLIESEIIDIAVGSANCFALDGGGNVWAWGANNIGQLGIPRDLQPKSPMKVPDLENISLVSAAGNRAAVLSSKGEIYAWGGLEGSEDLQAVDGVDPGDFGVGGASYPFTAKPYKVPLPTIVAVSTGYSHTLALDQNLEVWGWGHNTAGQLGLNIGGGIPNPIKVEMPQAVQAIAAGESFSLALLNDGTVWALGQGLGLDKSKADNNGLHQLSTRADTIGISAGGHHALTLHHDGSVSAIGRNIYGQLGDGTIDDRHTLTHLNLTNIKEISAGYDYSLALKDNGDLLAWGNNEFGQLGDGTTKTRLLPEEVKISS